MINVLVECRIFAAHWAERKILIKCNNEAMVCVLKTKKTRDTYLAMCERNMWYISSIHDIDLQCVHIRGKNNAWEDCLSW